MIVKRWNTLLLSGLLVLIPTAVSAQTSQSQSHTVCSVNSNESDGNQVIVEGNCSQTIINNTYVYDGVLDRQTGTISAEQVPFAQRETGGTGGDGYYPASGKPPKISASNSGYVPATGEAPRISQ